MFLSSHVLAEVEEVAGRVAVVRAGRVVDVDDVGSLRERAGQQVLLRFASPVPAREFLGVPGCVADVSPFSWYIGDDPLLTGVDRAGVASLAAPAVVAVVRGWAGFRRRDVMV